MESVEVPDIEFHKFILSILSKTSIGSINVTAIACRWRCRGKAVKDQYERMIIDMKTIDFFGWLVVLTWLMAFETVAIAQAGQDGRSKVQQEVEQVIVDAYIQGIHVTQDEKRVKAGFHEGFRMLVPAEDGIRPVSADEWLGSIEQSKQKNPEMWEADTTYHFDWVDVTDNAASVKIQVYKGKKHFSTDYMLLYRFEDGWKIVSKIFKMY